VAHCFAVKILDLHLAIAPLGQYHWKSLRCFSRQCWWIYDWVT